MKSELQSGGPCASSSSWHRRFFCAAFACAARFFLAAGVVFIRRSRALSFSKNSGLLAV